MEIYRIKTQLGPIWFLLKFFVTYLILFLIYSAYLNYFASHFDALTCDGITRQVALDSARILRVLGYDATTVPNSYISSMMLQVDGRTIANVIEGCNAVSIMILFVAFMVAFSNKLKTTVFYTILGLGILYLVNVLRIALLTIGFIEIPQYGDFLHDYMFPAVLYGVTLTLWLVWIKYYAPKPKKRSND